MPLITASDVEVEDVVDIFNPTLDGGDDFDRMKPYGDYDYLDISENIANITAMENKISDALYLYDDIIKSKGMNQSFAIEAMKVIPDFGGVPIKYYTESTTLTRYKLAIEELSAGIWAMIAAAALAIAAMLGKFISWLFGDSDSSSSNSGGKKRTVTPEELTEVGEAVADSAEALDDLNRGGFELAAQLAAQMTAPTVWESVNKPTKHVSFNDIISEYIKSDKGKSSDLANFFINQNNFIFAIFTEESEISTYIDHISRANATVEKYLEIYKKSNTGMHDEIKYIKNYKDDRISEAETNTHNAKIDRDIVDINKLFGDLHEDKTTSESLLTTIKAVISNSTNSGKFANKTLTDIYKKYSISRIYKVTSSALQSTYYHKEKLSEVKKSLKDAANALHDLANISVNAKNGDILKRYVELIKLRQKLHEEIVVAITNEYSIVKAIATTLNVFGKQLMEKTLPAALLVVERRVGSDMNLEVNKDVKEKYQYIKSLLKNYKQ